MTKRIYDGRIVEDNDCYQVVEFYEPTENSKSCTCVSIYLTGIQRARVIKSVMLLFFRG